MKQKYILPIITTLILGLILGACIPSIFSAPVVRELDLAATSAAQTVQAQMTEAVIASMVAELTRVAQENQATQTAVPPTATQIPPTATQTTVPPTATQIPPTATPFPPTATPTPCYWAQFIKDISVPDGSDISAGTSFTKTWRLKNVGTCTWTSDFDLTFVSGNAMSAPAAVDINSTVRPGEVVDLSVQMVAPDKAGSYTGYWQLRSHNGILFGLGANQNISFWVEIDVPADYVSIDPDKALDFATYYQSAVWRTAKGNPTSNGSDDYTNGSIYRTSSPKMEKTHTDDEQALIMIPNDGSGGMISGEYPAVNVKSGDRLKGIIGCTSDSPDCNVMFQINYSADGGATQNLGSWTEVYDGNWTFLDLDLSALAGKSVRFTLLVFNNGSSKNDRVFWLAPAMVR